MNSSRTRDILYAIDTVTMFVFVAVIILALTGCKDGPRDQAAADAIAGIDAMTIVAPETQPIAVGATDHVLATRGLERRGQLPTPRMAPATIVNNADAYQQQGKDAIEASKSLGFVGILLGAAVAIAGIIKATGLGGPLVQMAATLVESRATKAQKQHASDLAGVGVVAIQVLESLPPEQGGAIKKAISKAVTPEQEAAIRRELANIATPGRADTV